MASPEEVSFLGISDFTQSSSWRVGLVSSRVLVAMLLVGSGREIGKPSGEQNDIVEDLRD